MTDADAPLPPDAPPDDDLPPTEEETLAANALREALEGRRAGTHLPEPALEAAALLRFSTDAGRLSDERRAALRAELMASLPQVPASRRTVRKGLRRWLGLGLTLAGGATAVVVIGVIGARQLSAPLAREEAPFSDARSVAAAPEAPAPGAATAQTADAPPADSMRLTAKGERESATEELSRSSPAARGRSGSAEPPALAPAQGVAARAASGARAPGGGGALAVRGELSAAPAEARDADEGAGPALGAVAARKQSAEPEREWSAESEKAAPPTPVVPTEQVKRESDKYRAELLAELADPRVDGAYGELDRAQSPAELERARERLGALASSSFGGSKANAERLRPDIYCRLAEVALRLGQPQAALDWARRGLALGAPASPFVARLYLLEGQAKSALGDRNGAAKSYLNAIEVNEQLLDQSLEAP
jgi:predicted negative regulator of RcsB-dependent stress response